MGRVEQFTSVGQHTYTASYNSIKWTNKVVLVVFQTQVNFNLIPTLLWAKGLSEASLHMAKWTAGCYGTDMLLRASLLSGYS